MDQTFKRNQVEDAIIQSLDAKGSRVNELKLRIKRLLVTDRRRVSRGAGNAAPRNYAFFSQQPPGSGVEVVFSSYEAFALLAAILLLEHGFPQAAVVRIIRDIRGDLEAAHRDSLKKDPERIFNPKAVQGMAMPGLIVTDNTDPVFLAIIRFSEAAPSSGKIRALITVCKGNEELAAFVKKHVAPGYGITFFELVSKIHGLAANLSQTRPVKRGRSSL